MKWVGERISKSFFPLLLLPSMGLYIPTQCKFTLDSREMIVLHVNIQSQNEKSSHMIQRNANAWFLFSSMSIKIRSINHKSLGNRILLGFESDKSWRRQQIYQCRRGLPFQFSFLQCLGSMHCNSLVIKVLSSYDYGGEWKSWPHAGLVHKSNNRESQRRIQILLSVGRKVQGCFFIHRKYKNSNATKLVHGDSWKLE